ncbi:restriction endonuclease subunit S [Vibrio furnissii]|uniref:restriction endonuclease subunit S n=1 Tax=Vibrio furnissii TaxID=29494 RepID=UPI00399B3A49
MESITEMPKYESYKDSGIDWIGEMPQSWELRRVKSFLRLVANPAPKNNSYELLSVYTDIGVKPRRELEEKGNKASTTDGYWKVREGDFIVNKLLAWMGAIGISNYSGVTSPAYDILRPYKGISGNFYHFMFRTKTFSSVMKKSSRGIMDMRLRLYFDKFGDIRVPFPPVEVQHLIAKFLEKKITQIEEAIFIKEQQISLLKERKQIIIQQAVTRGLDPNVLMKNSGVDWIGQIPTHWEIKRIKHVTSKIGSGITPSGGGATYLDEGIPLLRSQNVHFDRIDIDDVARISLKTHNEMANTKVKKGDVLLNITGGSIGRCFYVDTNEEMNVNQHVCIVRPTKDIETIFLNAVLASEVGQGQIWFFQQGGGREGLNFQSLKNFWLALPPKQEQREIVNYINKVSVEMNNIVDSLQKQISKIKDYRSSLVNSAVTGKIKITPEMVEG